MSIPLLIPIEARTESIMSLMKQTPTNVISLPCCATSSSWFWMFDLKLPSPSKLLGSVWFEDKGGCDMVIHGFRDMDIFGWMDGTSLFLFG